jgi:hypothetical protein
MDNNYTQIEKYLRQEMNEAEKVDFESRLATDKELLKELNVQRQITQAAVNTGIKNEFRKAIRRKVLKRQLINACIVLAVIAAAVLVYAVKNNLFQGKSNREAIKTEQQPEQFIINNATDTIIETKEGIVFAIPANAFNSTDKNIELEIKTALDANSIIQQGLSTVSNGSLLQTAGMFYIAGRAGGQPVSLSKEIAVSIPAGEINPAMQLFDGVEGEGTGGQINWVNPKPIEKKLRTYDIATLDFYPTDYIPTLKALKKNYRNKKYTDSLYYSFSGYPYQNEIENPGNAKDTAGTTAINERPVIDLIRDTTQKYFGDSSLVKQLDLNDEGKYTSFEIDPARIKAIRDKRFNNTSIATKEFEERIHYLHTLCTGEYLEIYLRNLDKPLYVSDQICAEHSAGAIKEKFNIFAARKDGGVIIATGIQEKLNIYFREKYTAYKEAAAKTWAQYEAELERLNNQADQKRYTQELRADEQKRNNFQEEFCINLTDAYRQIGIRRSCDDTLPNYYNITISTTGWKNLDVYVYGATQDRQSMTYTDPTTGRTAKIIYNETTISIENQQQFDKLLVYLIPDSLSSFQRVNQQGDLFKEQLNALFHYDAVVLAYKGTDVFYFRQKSIQPAAYTFRLSPVSNNMLQKSLQEYSVNRTKDLQSEFEYQLSEQEESIRQLQLQKDLQFREQVAAAIFKCGREGAVPDTVPSRPK